MSLLIKGLDMPKLDENEERLWVPGWIEVGKDGKAIFCTGTHFDPNTIHSYAVEEVSAPHGRLIDADYLINVLQDTIDNYPDNCNDGNAVEKLVVNACRQYIEHCPTVIGAEVSE